MGMLLRRHRKDDRNGQAETRNSEGHEAEAQQENEGQETTEQPEEQAQALEVMTVPELKEKAKESDVQGYSTMNKGELIEALKG